MKYPAKYVPNTKFIDQLPDLCVSLELISVYDLGCYSTQELLYILGNRINSIIANMEHNDKALEAQLQDLRDRIDFLLGEGLQSEIIAIFEKMYEDGTLTELVQEAMADIQRRITRLERNKHAYTLKDFNYKGCGEEPVTYSLQAALDQAFADGGGTVIVSPGEHVLSAGVVIRQNTHLILEDGAVMTALPIVGSMLLNGKADDTFTLYGGNGNIVIEGGTWISNVPGEEESQRSIFGFGHADGVTVKNVTFKNVKSSHAIDLNSSHNVLIEDCKFLGFKNTEAGNRTYAEAIQIDVHTPLSFTHVGSPDRTPNKNIVVRANYFGPSESYGPWGVGVGNHGAVHDVYNENIYIEGNTFDGMIYAGVRTFKWKNTFITSNSFKNCKIGIMTTSVQAGTTSAQDKNGNPSGKSQAGDTLIINSNKFEDCAEGSVTASGNGTSASEYALPKNTIITENVFTYANGALNELGAIYLTKVDTVKVKNNIFNGVGRAVWFRQAKNADFSGNTVVETEKEAVYITDGGTGDYLNGVKFNDGIVIDNNEMRNIGRSAINITEAQNLKLFGNRVINAGTQPDTDRVAITMSATDKIIVTDNIVEQVANQRNSYGIQIGSSCSNATIYDNIAYGKTAGLNVSQSALRAHGRPGQVKWETFPSASGVTAYPNTQPQMSLGANGLVVFRGALTHGKGATGETDIILGTLPTGYRPEVTQTFITDANNLELNRIRVSYTGDVVLEHTNSTAAEPFTNLDGISFYAYA